MFSYGCWLVLPIDFPMGDTFFTVASCASRACCSSPLSIPRTVTMYRYDGGEPRGGTAPARFFLR